MEHGNDVRFWTGRVSRGVKPPASPFSAGQVHWQSAVDGVGCLRSLPRCGGLTGLGTLLGFWSFGQSFVGVDQGSALSFDITAGVFPGILRSPTAH